MKLYICLTTYHMLAACAMAIQDKNNDGELLVEGFVDEESDILKGIRESSIFKNIYYVNQTDAWKEINKLDMTSSKMQIMDAAKTTVRFWSERFEHFKKIDSRYSDINLWEDHFTFGVALAYLKIPYNYFEESPGCHYRRDVFIQLSKNRITNKAFAPIAEQFGLRGKYPYAKTICYDFELNQIERNEKDVDFSLVKELKFIKEIYNDKFQLIKEIFAKRGYIIGNEEIENDISKRNFLLIGQHYSVNTYRNISTIRYALSLLVDYFGEDMNLWIKNHPSNYFNPLQHWFLDAHYIVDNVPLELMIADDVLRFDRVASISSSAPLVMKSTGTDVILFQNKEDGDSFESQKRFLDIHRYYIAVKLINKISDEKEINNIYTCGVERLSLDYLLKYHMTKEVSVKELTDDAQLLSSKREFRIFIFDRLENSFSEFEEQKRMISQFLLSCNKYDVVFFINSDNNDAFFDMNNIKTTEYLYPLPFEVVGNSDSDLFGCKTSQYPLEDTFKKLNQESYMDTSKKERQIIYMYTKNKDISQMLLSHHIEKKLQHCGIELNYNPMSTNYRELVFESMLEQLEKQYLILQEENDKLKVTISEKSSNNAMKNDVIQNNAMQNNIMQNYVVQNQEILEAINESSKKLLIQLSNIENQSSTMLMDRLTEIDGRIIHLLSWYGFKERIKEKLQLIFKSK